MTQQSRFSSKNILLALVFLLGTSLLSFFAILSYSITQVNAESRHTIENHLAAVFADKLEHQATLAKDYAYWDDTIQHAYLSQDQHWIDENIGIYLSETFGITDLFIINSADEAVLSLKSGQQDQANYLSLNKAALADLISKARKSGPVPTPVSGMLMINDIPAVVGVAVLTPESNKPLPSPRPLLVVALQMDQNFLQKLSEQYRLKDLRFIPAGQSTEDVSLFTLKNPLGEVLGKLVWHTEKPGTLVLHKVQIPMLIVLGLIVLVTTLIIKAFRNTELRLEKAYHDLEYHANHDPLTGLANRRLFSELLIQLINSVKREQTRCAMLYLDLDDFKNVNDTHGHQAGDELLVTVAQRLKSCVRESDVIARIGGDEFIVLLMNASSHEDIKAMANKLIASLTHPIKLANHDIQIGASIGITIIPEDGTNPDELLKKSDLALYQGKNQGRNTVNFYRDLN